MQIVRDYSVDGFKPLEKDINCFMSYRNTEKVWYSWKLEAHSNSPFLHRWLCVDDRLLRSQQKDGILHHPDLHPLYSHCGPLLGLILDQERRHSCQDGPRYVTTHRNHDSQAVVTAGPNQTEITTTGCVKSLRSFFATFRVNFWTTREINNLLYCGNRFLRQF